MMRVSSVALDLPAGYIIQEDGAVISLRSGVPRTLSVHVANTGYPAVRLKHESGGITCTVHRLLARAFIPNPEGKPQVNHIDGNKLNFALDNLEWVTDSENKTHARSLGLVRNTAKNVAANKVKARKMMLARRRFSDADITTIKAMLRRGDSRRRIARVFDCSHTSIANIANGTAYQKTNADLAASILVGA